MNDFVSIETMFRLPEPYFDVVGAKFMSTATKEGHHKLPDIFYSGVIYTIAAGNAHGLEVSIACTCPDIPFYSHLHCLLYSQYSDRRRLSSKTDEDFLADMRNDLQSMQPRPTHIFDRWSYCLRRTMT